MGSFDVIKQTVTTFLDDGANDDSLYSRRSSKDESLRQKFRVPDPETLMSRVRAAIYSRPLGPQAQDSPSTIVDDFQEGELILSESFSMFESELDPRLLSFVLPLATVRRVKRRSSGGSRRFVLEITSYQDSQLVADLDELYSNCSEFCRSLSGNLSAQAPLGEQSRRISTSFYSEFVVESANMRRKGHTKPEILAASAIPKGGLGREFGYPGDARASHERAKMRSWLEYFQRHGRNIGMVREPPFYKLLRVGLPNASRGELWEVCCGSVHSRMKSRQLYTSSLEDHAAETSQATDEIAKDSNRSSPEFPAYQSPKGIESSRRVSTAYSWMVPEVGYCQAMNIVTAALSIFQTEEQAFWTSHVLVHRILPGYYSRTMYGMSLDQKVLECLVERTMPVSWRHFEATDVPSSVVSSPWFSSSFANTMPSPFAFRIIDISMNEGSRALFQVALAVSRVNGEELLEATDNTAVIGISKSYFDTSHSPAQTSSARSKPITKFQESLVTAFKEFSVVTNQWIHDSRAKHEAPVLADIESYAKRTQSRNIARPHNSTPEQCGIVYDTFYAALQATRPGLGGNQGELTYYQFVTFLSQLVDWVHPRIVAREDAERAQSSRRSFSDWDTRKASSSTLADCVAGLDNLANRDMMELINYFFRIFSINSENDAENDAATETHHAKLTQQDILDVADGMLMMMRPFSETHDGAIVLDAETSQRFARLSTPRRTPSVKSTRSEASGPTATSATSVHSSSNAAASPVPGSGSRAGTPMSPTSSSSRQTSPPPAGAASSDDQKAASLAKSQQDQSAKYLGAVSSFIQRSYEVAGYKLVQPQVGKVGKASVSEAEPSIVLDKDGDDDDKPVDKDNAGAGDAEKGSSVAHFRMVILADETLERFFSETSRTTIHLTEQGTGVSSNRKFGANAFRSMMDNVMREGSHIADGSWRNNAITDERADELDDDTTVKASDRALLDL